MKSSYVFSAALAAAALGAVPGLSNHSQAVGATLAAFTFESTQTPFTVSGTGTAVSSTGAFAGTNSSSSTFLQYASSTGGTSVGPLTAESGTGSAYGVHAAATAFSEPVGNGSQKSFSANNFAAGDYYEFQVPTLGTLTDLFLSFDQVRSGSGPAGFALVYGAATVGTAVETVLGTIGTYAPLSTVSFGAAASSPAASFGFDLSSISDQLALLPTAFFRLVATVSGAAAGTSRVDNFVVQTAPEPTAMAVTLIAAGGLLRRRRA